MRNTIMPLLQTFKKKKNKYNLIFDFHVMFNVDQNAQFPFLIYLRMIQFGCTGIGNCPDGFTPLNEMHNFYVLR